MIERRDIHRLAAAKGKALQKALFPLVVRMTLRRTLEGAGM